MGTQLEKVEKFKRVIIAGMLSEYNTQHGADGRFAGAGSGVGVGGFGNTTKGKDNRAPAKEPVGDQKAIDDFVTGLGDINLETKAGVQKYHTAKQDFLREQGVEDKDVSKLDALMQDFTTNVTHPGAVEMARMNNLVTGRPEMTGIRKSAYLPAKSYETKISPGLQKAHELSVKTNQSMLKSKFGDEITLHRGIAYNQARGAIGSAKGGKVDIEVGALSSWTSKTKIAQDFAIGGVAGAKPSGAVISNTFKTSNIMDSHFTNRKLFSLRESEVVVGGVTNIKGATLGKHVLAKRVSVDIRTW